MSGPEGLIPLSDLANDTVGQNFLLVDVTAKHTASKRSPCGSFPWSISFVVTYTSITSHRPKFLMELDPLGFSGHQKCLFASSISQGRQKQSGHSMKVSGEAGNVSVTLCSSSAPHSHPLYAKSTGIAARFYSVKLTVTFVAIFRSKVTRTFIFIRKK